MMLTSPEAHTAVELGAKKVEQRLNWTWAFKFESAEKAGIFADMLKNSGFEVRGPHDFGDEERGHAVGWKPPHPAIEHMRSRGER